MNSAEEMYLKFYDHIFRYCLSLSHNFQVAEDITQTVFEKALRNLNKLPENSNVRAWLYSIARNTYYTYYKSERHYEDIESSALKSESAIDPERQYIHRENIMNMHIALHEIREPYKEVFSLRTFGELSFKEIGMIFSRSETWSRVTYYRARKMLMEVLENEI
ncbi:MAG: RNA polymerase sigma factor [Hornefia sp.]|nr:RNA polymerase sigma factor [Hornefia sp.]